MNSAQQQFTIFRPGVTLGTRSVLVQSLQLLACLDKEGFRFSKTITTEQSRKQDANVLSMFHIGTQNINVLNRYQVQQLFRNHRRKKLSRLFKLG